MSENYLKTFLWKKSIFTFYISSMYSLKFIFFNMEPSLQYGSITNKRDDNYEKNKENKTEFVPH